MKFVEHTIVALATTVLSVAAVSVHAHESRVIKATEGPGSIRLTIGFSGEPAFEDSYNGVDVIINTYDKACTETTRGYFGAPIDPARTPLDPGDTKDTVDLQVEALYLAYANPPTGNYGSIAPTGILKRLVLTDKSPLEAKFNTPGTFNTFFRPTHPGVYGFHIYGTVSAGPNISKNCPGHTEEYRLEVRTATVDVFYVCSESGSYTPPSHFSCVETDQAFPGFLGAAYKPNWERRSYYGYVND
jgi:hypothetical protein